MHQRDRLRRIAELESDRHEVEIELKRYDIQRRATGLTRVQDTLYGWLWQRRKDIDVELSEFQTGTHHDN